MATRAKVRAISDLVKPELPLAAGICVVAGELLALGRLPDADIALLGFLTGFFVSGAAMISNDYFDLEVDRVNHPDRPLPSGRISTTELLTLTCAFTFVGLLAALFLSCPAFVLALVSWVIALLYNWRFKESGIPGNMMVSYSVAVMFLFGGVAAGHPFSGVVWAFGVLAFMFDLAEEIAGGAMDMRGDEMRSVRSLARMRGRAFALRVSMALYVGVTVLSVVPYIAGWLGEAYLLLVVPTDVLLLYLATRLLKSIGEDEGRRVIRRLYLTMVVFIVAIIFGSLL